MKLVAAARLRRAQDAIIAARPYAQRARARSSPSWRGAPATTRTRCSSERELKNASRSSCSRPTAASPAASTPTSSRRVERFVGERAGERERGRRCAIIGKKGRDYFRRRNATIASYELGADRRDRARRVAREIAQPRSSTTSRDGKVDARLPRLQRVQVARARSGVARRAAPAGRAASAERRRSRRRRDRLPLRAVARRSCSTRSLPLYVEIADLPRAARVDRRRASARA